MRAPKLLQTVAVPFVKSVDTSKHLSLKILNQPWKFQNLYLQLLSSRNSANGQNNDHLMAVVRASTETQSRMQKKERWPEPFSLRGRFMNDWPHGAYAIMLSRPVEGVGRISFIKRRSGAVDRSAFQLAFSGERLSVCLPGRDIRDWLSFQVGVKVGLS